MGKCSQFIGKKANRSGLSPIFLCLFLPLKLQLKSKKENIHITVKKRVRESSVDERFQQMFWKKLGMNMLSKEMELRKLRHRGVHSGYGNQSSQKDDDKAMMALNVRWRMNMRFLEVFYETNVPPCLLHHAERQAIQGFL